MNLSILVKDLIFGDDYTGDNCYIYNDHTK